MERQEHKKIIILFRKKIKEIGILLYKNEKES